MLILFDIDGTLLLSRRAGARSMLEAARRLHGADIIAEGLEFAGRLDPQIWADLARINGIHDFERRTPEFRSAYADVLKEMLESQPLAYALPGVASLIDRLRSEPGFTLGLLTGNFPETGRLKILAAGMDPDHFPVSAWGDDGSQRRDLPRVAMQRYREFTGRGIEPERIVVVGDTPHDIDCAHANGCLALGVATGPSYSLEDLRQHRPDFVVADLSETDAILQWLRTCMDGHPTSPQRRGDSENH